MKKLLAVSSLLACLTGNGPAMADTITTNLTFWNESALNTAGDYVRVTLSGATTGSYTTLSFQYFDGNAAAPYGVTMDKVGWNGSVGVSTCPAGWSCNGTATNQAGFGSFTEFETLAPAPQGTGVTSPVTFGLASAISGFNSLGTMISHVRYTNSCSGFVGNVAPSGGATGTSCGTSQVPEPSALLLLGVGVIGAAAWQRRSRMQPTSLVL